MELMGGCLCGAVRFSVTEADNTRRRLKTLVRKALESAEVALEDAR